MTKTDETREPTILVAEPTHAVLWAKSYRTTGGREAMRATDSENAVGPMRVEASVRVEAVAAWLQEGEILSPMIADGGVVTRVTETSHPMARLISDKTPRTQRAQIKHEIGEAILAAIEAGETTAVTETT